MSQLSDRFQRDLNIRNYSPRTIRSYTLALRQIGRHTGKCPSQVSIPELKDYLDFQVKQGKSWSTINVIISAVNLLYTETLGEPPILDRINRPKTPVKLPSVLSSEEVASKFALTLSNISSISSTLIFPFVPTVTKANSSP